MEDARIELLKDALSDGNGNNALFLLPNGHRWSRIY